MSATSEISTKDQVRAFMDDGEEDAVKISDQLGVGKATIYNHMRHIREERGEKPRRRGRPPAVKKDGSPPAAVSRPAPPKAKAAPTPQVLRVREPDNGRDAGTIARLMSRPRVKAAIEAELEDERRETARVESWLKSLS
jgi:hypothetical protein